MNLLRKASETATSEWMVPQYNTSKPKLGGKRMNIERVSLFIIELLKNNKILLEALPLPMLGLIFKNLRSVVVKVSKNDKSSFAESAFEARGCGREGHSLRVLV